MAQGWFRRPKGKLVYVWQVEDSKTGRKLERAKGELFAFAGIWDRWKDAGGNWVKSCSILTTTPNAVTLAVHDRMPVILDPQGFDLWLDPGMKDAAAASELLKPHDAQTMRCYPVGTRVNHVANDDEECSRSIELSDTQNSLFT